MRTHLVLAGAAALGGAAFLIPAVAAQAPGVTADIEIACTTGVGGAATHSYKVTVTNESGSTITILTETDTLTVNAGTPLDLPDPDDSEVANGQTATYPTAVPLTPDGDVAVTAVYSATYNGGQTPITVTATAEACGATATTAPPEPTTSTSTPAIVAEVDFTG